MPTFAYVARDREGNKSEGTLSTKDANELRTILREKDLFLTKIREQRGAAQGAAVTIRRKKAGMRDMVVLSRQFATLVRAGLPLVECLHVLAQQSENPFLVQVMKDVRLDILTGSTLTDAMRKHPRAFREAYVALVQAGEAGGVLEKTLDIAATQLNKEAELREKVKSAFVYPTLVLIASILVVLFMLVFIVPVFAKVYTQFNAKLPAITQMLVTVSFVVVHWWYIVAGALVVLYFALNKYVQTEGGRRHYDAFKLRMPLLGKLNRKIAISRFTQTLAGAMEAGVPLLRALIISANTSGNVIIMSAISRVSQFIKEGATISVPLADTGQFPPMVVRMIAAGEQSGNMGEMLDEITAFYEQDIEYTVERLTRLMEPIMTVMVGGIVLFVLLALYMPVFNLANVIKK